MAIRLTESRLRQIIREEAARIAETGFTGRLGSSQSVHRTHPGPSSRGAAEPDLLPRLEDFAMESSLWDEALMGEIDTYDAASEIVDAFVKNEGLHYLGRDWYEDAVIHLSGVLDDTAEGAELEEDF